MFIPRKGEGTTFSIYLPATEEKLEEEKKLPDGLVKGNETVLLVDDEKMVLDAGGAMLKYLGYEVLLAKTVKRHWIYKTQSTQD
jgi:two-component system cell cycle sensor histidine kinase/response regulator CckA